MRLLLLVGVPMAIEVFNGVLMATPTSSSLAAARSLEEATLSLLVAPKEALNLLVEATSNHPVALKEASQASPVDRNHLTFTTAEANRVAPRDLLLSTARDLTSRRDPLRVHVSFLPITTPAQREAREVCQAASAHA